MINGEEEEDSCDLTLLREQLSSRTQRPSLTSSTCNGFLKYSMVPWPCQTRLLFFIAPSQSKAEIFSVCSDEAYLPVYVPAWPLFTQWSILNLGNLRVSPLAMVLERAMRGHVSFNCSSYSWKLFHMPYYDMKSDITWKPVLLIGRTAAIGTCTLVASITEAPLTHYHWQAESLGHYLRASMRLPPIWY